MPCTTKNSVGFEPGTPWLVGLASHDWATRAGCYFSQWSDLWICQFTNRSDINKFWSDITRRNDITYIIPERSDINKFWLWYSVKEWYTCIIPWRSDINNFGGDITHGSDISYIIPERSDIDKNWSDITQGSDITYIIPQRSDINKIWGDITQGGDITYIIPERSDIDKIWSDITRGWYKQIMECDITYITPIGYPQWYNGGVICIICLYHAVRKLHPLLAGFVIAPPTTSCGVIHTNHLYHTRNDIDVYIIPRSDINIFVNHSFLSSAHLGMI